VFHLYLRYNRNVKIAWAHFPERKTSIKFCSCKIFEIIIQTHDILMVMGISRISDVNTKCYSEETYLTVSDVDDNYKSSFYY